jgi:hypothetical protein
MLCLQWVKAIIAMIAGMAMHHKPGPPGSSNTIDQCTMPLAMALRQGLPLHMAACWLVLQART